jgi:hypothetical protein
MEGLKKTIILIVLALAISQAFFTSISVFRFVDNFRGGTHITTTGKASGIVSFCINTPPTINLSDCSPNATQGISYDCSLNASDLEYVNFVYSATFDEVYRPFNISNSSLFNMTSDGYIYFLPANQDVGNYTIIFRTNDGMGCSNSGSATLFELEVINVNDPPVFGSIIPQQAYKARETLHAFFLNNYFSDPDLDPLTYSVSGNSLITITILNSSEVLISADECNITEVVIFSAFDPYNETNSSNAVVIKCEENQEEVPGGIGSGGSSGGGGGGMSRPCISEYECFDVRICRKNNTKLQMCVDIKGCNDEHYISVPCKYEERGYCNESWKCSGWGLCLPNGTQYRNCTDDKKCDTVDFRPLISRSCEYIGNCDDGISNCHDGACEENIDCGGPCSPCKSIEVPYPFTEERGIGVYILTGLILLLLTAILVYHYFKKEINEALAKAGWLVGRKKKKQFLISKDDKKKLLVGLAELDKKIGQQELPETASKYSELERYYLLKAVDDKSLDPDFDQQKLQKAIDGKKRRIVPLIRKIFISMFSNTQRVLVTKEMMTYTNIHLLIEGLRNITLQTSESEPEDSARETVEFKVPDKAQDAERLLISIINAYIALQFVEVEVAKKKYLSLIADYEKLGLNEQEAVFEHLGELYNNISYVNSWASPKQ